MDRARERLVTSPQRDRVRSPQRDRVRSPQRDRVRSPQRDRVRSPQRARSPPSNRDRDRLRYSPNRSDTDSRQSFSSPNRSPDGRKGEREWHRYPDAWERLAVSPLNSQRREREYEDRMRQYEQGRHQFPRGEVEWQGRVYNDSWKRLAEDTHRYAYMPNQPSSVVHYQCGDYEWKGRVYQDSWKRLTSPPREYSPGRRPTSADATRRTSPTRDDRYQHHRRPLTAEHGRVSDDSFNRLTAATRRRTSTSPSRSPERTSPTRENQDLGKSLAGRRLVVLSAKIRDIDTALSAVGPQADTARRMLHDLANVLV
eukprot:gnl/Spiro4/22073_TR10861_c0_g1_i1.p1 gnl/Spiro4/22073_TR10861_c0_g1~~gnl/Spiro4/22073_TR10861_c0_g1_i1.p1  ORF type:complete len:320 (+),score=35.46 gnl/Spiro4/22073_TR10861_c0_g1_i1:27-962(+)